MVRILDKILIFTLPVALLGFYFNIVSPEIGGLILAVLAVVGTVPVFLNAAGGLRMKKLSVDLLALVALVVSIVLKEWASAVFINLMLVSARIFDYYSQNTARAAIKSLLKLRPENVKVIEGDKVLVKNIKKIKRDDLIAIESGERVPVDGIIEKGDANIDQSSLTGESVPVAKTVGDRVLSSTLNVSGSLLVRVDKVGPDTMFEKIIELVEKAQKEKPRITGMADKFTAWYIIATLIGSTVLYLLSNNTLLVLSVLLVACADDIAVAIPMAFLVSIGRAAKRGVIIKGSNFIETLVGVKTLIVDKTGTLTRGKLNIQSVVPFGAYTKEDVVKFAATAEFFSNHSAAKAIVKYAGDRNIEFIKPKDFKEVPGKGETAMLDGKRISVGKLSFLNELGVKISDEQNRAVGRVKSEGFNITLVGLDNELIGFVVLADQIRPNVKETVTKLRNMGISHWVMLTGDNENVAKKIAEQATISEFHANLLPEDKLNFIKKHLNSRSKIAMVGDGVNDAAALALADIGIAMGTIGSDAAIEAADIALMNDDFSKIPEIVAISRRTMRICVQNFWIWGLINILGFILVFNWFIGPQGAAAYNFITDFIPILNSFRLFKNNII